MPRKVEADSVDMGKVQAELRNARSLLKKAIAELKRAQSAYASARDILERRTDAFRDLSRAVLTRDA